MRIESDPSSSHQSPADEFQQFLASKLQDLEHSQLRSQDQLRDFAAGRTERVHEVSIAVQKARLRLKMASMIRGKVLDAYKELMTLR